MTSVWMTKSNPKPEDTRGVLRGVTRVEPMAETCRPPEGWNVAIGQ